MIKLKDLLSSFEAQTKNFYKETASIHNEVSSLSATTYYSPAKKTAEFKSTIILKDAVDTEEE